jgi:hypothetical protein
LYNIYGAWLAGFVIREFGIFPGLQSSLVLFIWSLKLFNRSDFKFLKLKLFTFLLMIIFSTFQNRSILYKFDCWHVFINSFFNNVFLGVVIRI